MLARNIEIDEAAITKALTRPARWKIPNDYAAARRAQNTGIPLAFEQEPDCAGVCAKWRARLPVRLRRRKKERSSVYLDEAVSQIGIRWKLMEKLNLEQFKADVHRTLISKLDLEKLSTDRTAARQAVASLVQTSSPMARCR